MSIINIESITGYRKVCQHIAQDIRTAKLALHLVRGIGEVATNSPEVLQDAPTFWITTRHCHYVTFIVSLYRAFDTQGNTLSLPNLLDTITSQLGQSVPNGKTAIEAGLPLQHLFHGEEAMIQRDKIAVKLLTRTFTRLRHTQVAHSGEVILTEKHIYPNNEIIDQCDEVIGEGFRLLDHYTRLDLGPAGILKTEHSQELAGMDDYRAVIEAITKHHADITGGSS